MSVNKKTEQLDAVSGDWPMLQALVGGTGAMRKAGKEFLPQWPGEDDQSYKERLAVAVLHPAFKRTCFVMGAKPFSRPMNVTAPDAVSALFEDVDNQGTPLSAYAAGLMFSCLSMGMTGVLVEYPKANGIRTKQEEQQAGVRPYFATYQAQSILGWRADRNGLTMLRLMESVEEQDGLYGTQTVEQVRVLKRGKWEIWRPGATKDDEWVLHDKGVTTISRIPFVFFYGNRLAFGVGQSPLLDLAFQNVEHWQSASDQQTILHVARVPILFAKGFGDATITIGASKAASTENTDADLTFVEHTGASIESGRNALLDLEDRMRATGAELISVKASSNITATQINSEDDGNKSTLQAITEAFEESLEAALNLIAEWLGVEQTAEVELYKDFSIATDSDPETLNTARDAGVISRETHFEELQRRDIVSPDRSWEDEKKRLTGEMPVKVDEQ